MTHTSLVANQRPHISLIDRRHFDDVALPIGMSMRLTTSAYVKRNAVARPLTALSHINDQVHRAAATFEFRTDAAHRCNALLCIFLHQVSDDSIVSVNRIHCS